MSIYRANMGGNIGTFFIVIYNQPILTFTSTRFVSGILPKTQMTGTRQHEDSTTLREQPCRVAAVVGYISYVRVASPRYGAASCFRRRLSSVTPPYRIFLLCCGCVGVL